MRITENRLYLYATAFFSGMSVMAVEMGASRLLTPYFSSSQVIWTVIIGHHDRDGDRQCLGRQGSG